MTWWLSALLRVVLTSFGFLVSFFPRKLELIVGPYIGRLVFWFHRNIQPKRSQVAYDNLKKCYPAISERERQSLLRQNYQHYGILILELFHLFSPIPGHYRRYILKNTKIHGLENFLNAKKTKRPLILVTAHVGNWEMMVACGALHGVNTLMVTKHLKPEWLHKKIEASRQSTGVGAVYEPKTLPGILRGLKELRPVGFAFDQYAGPPIGIEVPFFGIKVGTLAAVGKLAKRSGALVLSVKGYRDADGIVHTCMQEPVDYKNQDLDEVEITSHLSSKVEGWVRENPDQWLWIHRRFKNVSI
ncbi:MAG: lysophospholipid acyltransferase family protein [Bacteriovoracia bacterium]